MVSSPRGVQRGSAPLRFFLSPKIGGLGVDIEYEGAALIICKELICYTKLTFALTP